jgi:hypothetical protein
VTLDTRTSGEALNGLSDLDHVALSRLITEAVWRVDHGFGDSVHELYVEDGELRYEGKVFAHGHDAIKEWGNDRREPSTSRHTALNLRFEADGPDRAKGTAVMVVYVALEERFGPEVTKPHQIGEADLWCLRTDDGWRFTSTDFHVMFDRREDPGDLF